MADTYTVPYQLVPSPIFYGAGGTPRFRHIEVKGIPFILDQESGALYQLRRVQSGQGVNVYAIQIPYHVIPAEYSLDEGIYDDDGDDDDNFDEDDEETIA